MDGCEMKASLMVQNLQEEHHRARTRPLSGGCLGVPLENGEFSCLWSRLGAFVKGHNVAFQGNIKRSKYETITFWGFVYFNHLGFFNGENGNCSVRDGQNVMNMCGHRQLDRGGITDEIYIGSPPEMCQNVKVIKMAVWKKCCQTVDAIWLFLLHGVTKTDDWHSERCCVRAVDSEVIWSSKYPDWSGRSSEDVRVFFEFTKGVNDNYITSSKLCH